MNLKEVEQYRKQFNNHSWQIIKLLSLIWLDIHNYKSITIQTNVIFTNVLQQIRECLNQMEIDINKSTVVQDNDRELLL